MSKRTRIVGLSGPTASGKTDLALRLAKYLPLELINADSVTVYEHFNIGAAKPNEEQLEKVPHQLLSMLAPHEDFDAALFIEEAARSIENSVLRGKIPLLVGGAGFYIRALLCGLVASRAATEDSAKAEVLLREESLQAQGLEKKAISCALHSWLQEIDWETASRLHPHDRARIRRALCFALTEGKSLAGEHNRHQNRSELYSALLFILTPPRDKLYERINSRVEKIFAQGLLEETKRIVSKYGESAKALGAIGYKEALGVLQGEFSLAEAIERCQLATRHYAKRQFTWWRNQPAKLAWSDLTSKLGPFVISKEGSLSLQRIVETISKFISGEHGEGIFIIYLDKYDKLLE